MSFYKKSFDFFGKIDNNKNFYIFNTTSPIERAEIISKIEKFENTPDFLKFYTNVDIESAFKCLKNLDHIYSSLYSENNTNNFNSNIDIYISALSTIFLLSNLISKNKLILNKAIDKAKKNLELFNNNKQINKNIQKKLNNYILHLIGIDDKRKSSLLLLNNNNNLLKIENFKICILNGKTNNLNPEIKIIDRSINNSSLNQEKTRDITNPIFYNNNTSKIIEDNLILDLRTPSFPKRIEEFNQIIQQNKNDNNDKLNDFTSKNESMNSLGIKDNDELNKKYLKKESIRSLYTLAPNSKFQEEKKIRASPILKFTLKEESSTKSNINININSNKKVKKSSKFMMNVRNQKTNNNIYNEDIKKQLKKQTFSDKYLKISKEKIMYKDLLIFINNLFKKDLINFEEKIKLKELVIAKSSILDEIYTEYYENNKHLLITQLKNLIK